MSKLSRATLRVEVTVEWAWSGPAERRAMIMFMAPLEIGLALETPDLVCQRSLLNQ
jgi:hypothetical protein